MGMLITKNAILVGGNQCLCDYELTTAFRDSHIGLTYEFRDGILRQTTSMEYTPMFKIDGADMEFREDFLVYLLDIDRCMENAVGNDSIWGGAEPYPHTRKPAKGGK